jgi:hypothetical protein
LAFAWQAAAVVRSAQGSGLTQTPAGQVAPAGQAAIGVQAQRLSDPLQSASVAWLEQGSFTATAGSCCEVPSMGVVSDCD